MGEESSVERHLRAGRDRLARIGDAVTAFRRLSPADYGHFLATIEADLGAGSPEMLAGGTPQLLLAGPAEAESPPPPADGTLREAVLDLLSAGQALTTLEIRQTLEKQRKVNRGSLHSEIHAMRKLGLLRSEGRGRGTRYARTSVTRAGTSREPSTRRESPRAGKRGKRDADEEHPARDRTPAPDAERLYAAAIGGHHLLTGPEECELSRRLEDVEVGLWERLLDGPLGAEARQLLSEGPEGPDDGDDGDSDGPLVEVTSAREARSRDLDRLIASRLIAPRPSAADDPLASHRSELRAIVAEADRIRDRFVNCNLRLVPSTIRRHGYHLTSTLSMGDLIQEGNFGLLKAISRFDYRRGLRFSTFATWWIRHYLVRARQNLGAEVRVPVHMQDLANKVRNAKVLLRRELRRDPTAAELAHHLKVSRKSLQSLERDWPKYREALPVFDSVGEDGATPAYLASNDPLADEVLARHQESGQLAAAIDRMPPKLAHIVRRRYGLDGKEPETLFEIGASMQLSRERVRQLEHQGLRRLRALLAEDACVAASATSFGSPLKIQPS